MSRVELIERDEQSTDMPKRCANIALACFLSSSKRMIASGGGSPPDVGKKRADSKKGRKRMLSLVVDQLMIQGMTIGSERQHTS